MKTVKFDIDKLYNKPFDWKFNKVTNHDWNLYHIPKGTIFYKGFSGEDISEILHNDDPNNFYNRDATWYSTPDVAYSYTGVYKYDNEDDDEDASPGCVAGFKTTQDLYLFDIFDMHNCEKLIKK